MSSGTPLSVTIAHDYQCPWSWVSLFQARRLKRDFPQIDQDWRGYELLPGTLASSFGTRPAPSERFLEHARTEEVPLPDRMPFIVSTHSALEGAEYVKDTARNRFDAYNEAVYRALWERSEDISDMDVLGAIARGIGFDGPRFSEAIASRQYGDTIISFDEGALADGITHVTTFRFRGEQCAEASYSTVSEMAERYLIWYAKKPD